MKKSSKKKNNAFNKFFSILYLIIVFLFIYFLNYINIFSVKVNIIITLLITLLSLILLFLINHNRVKNNIKNKSIIIAFILMIVFGIIDFYGLKTLNFFTKISGNNKEVINYSVVVLNNSDIEKIGSLKKEKVGYSSNDEKALDEIKDYGMIFTSYTDMEKCYSALLNKKVAAIIVEDSMKKMAEENNASYASKTKVIYTFKIVEDSMTTAKSVDVTNTPFNVYISGIDTFGEIASVSRSDVNIVATINPMKHKILLTAIPRDYYVQLYGKKGYKDKLTHAGIYGVDESIATIENVLGIDINYYMKVNFTSVIDIVNLLGGVNVYSEHDFTSVDGYNFKKGDNNLYGEKALAFVRERYAFTDGDRQRGRNQEAMIKAIIEKMTKPSVLLKYDGILSKLSTKMETNADDKMILSLIKMQLANNVAWEIESYNLDGENALQYTYSYPNQKLYVMIPDKDVEAQAKEKIDKLMGDINE